MLWFFNMKENVLSHNERATNWFGHGYSWLSDGKNIVYEFPYQSSESVIQALTSPFAVLLARDELIPVIVKKKSFLHDSPNIEGKTKKYLIAGDKATVDEYRSGWCQVNYTGGKTPLQMWINTITNVDNV
jgi:hypothetical protein